MFWNEILKAFSWLYAINNILLSLFSINILFLLIVAFVNRKKNSTAIDLPADNLPSVLIQLPLFNERYVVERLIHAATAIDYPANLLEIQILDDSTDDTSAIAEKMVLYYRSLGKNIQYIHRTDRSGYKAGALETGLKQSKGEIIAVFDADFIPQPDFLQKAIPEFMANSKLGILQGRWEHLNLEENPITRIIALGLDLHFGVDQIARSRSGMMMNCNGSVFLIRRQCIQDAGSWQSDTLVEDTDLSYRAQLNGWKIYYRPDISVPGELPSDVLAFKQQQFRWAKGAIQVLLKLAGPILKSSKPLLHKIEGLIHLSSYFASPLMLLSILLSLPVVLMNGYTPIHWAFLGVAFFIPPVAMIYSQIYLRKNIKLLWYYPLLLLIGVGLSVTNTSAIWQAIIGKKSEFVRTPKYSNTQRVKNTYALPVDWATWVETGLAIYGLFTGIISLERAPFLAPFIFMYSIGFALTAGIGFYQAVEHPIKPRVGKPLQNN